MPYSVINRNNMHCVVKRDDPDGRVFGCHQDPQRAYAQIAAIEASEYSTKADQDEIDETFAQYHDLVNMSASELEAWADTEASTMASLSRAPINRNLRLLRTPKDEWGSDEVREANRTIGFISRMSAAQQGKPVITQGGRDYSRRDASLLNWAHDPAKTKETDVPEGVRNPDLWQQARNTVRNRVRTWPSAYASGQVVQEYERLGGTYTGKKALDEWFAERWVDISRPKDGGGFEPCGRDTANMSEDDYRRAYPKCLPAREAAALSEEERRRLIDRKRNAPNTPGGPSYVSSDPDPQRSKGLFTVFKQANGDYRWVAISSTAYLDRDNEIVSTKALQGVVRRGDQTGDRGVLRWWHMQGSDLGSIDFQALSSNDRLLVESGTFDDQRVAQSVATKQDTLGLSIGFSHAESEPGPDGVFEDIRKFETSLLPKEMASNRFTSLTVEEKSVDTEKIKALKALLGDSDAFSDVLENIEKTNKAAQASGVRYKDADTITTPDGQTWRYTDGSFEAVPEPEPAAQSEKMAMPIGRDELASLVRSAMMTAMDMYVSKIEDGMEEKMRKMMGEYERKMGDYSMKAADGVRSELETLKQERAALGEGLKDVNRRLQELEGDQPRANVYRASIADDTITDKETPQPPQGEDVLGEITNALFGMNGGPR
jgi:hypothetical protein